MVINALKAILTLREGLPVQVALPHFAQPLSGLITPGTGHWFEIVMYYAKDTSLALGLIIATAAFLWIAWITIAKFNEARKGRTEWSELVFTSVIAAGILMLMSYGLFEATGIIT